MLWNTWVPENLEGLAISVVMVSSELLSLKGHLIRAKLPFSIIQRDRDGSRTAGAMNIRKCHQLGVSWQFTMVVGGTDLEQDVRRCPRAFDAHRNVVRTRLQVHFPTANRVRGAKWSPPVLPR